MSREAEGRNVERKWGRGSGGEGERGRGTQVERQGREAER